MSCKSQVCPCHPFKGRPHPPSQGTRPVAVLQGQLCLSVLGFAGGS